MHQHFTVTLDVTSILADRCLEGQNALDVDEILDTIRQQVEGVLAVGIEGAEVLEAATVVSVDVRDPE
jgi:hypothetical protein